jgi:hypothetical protein
LVIWKGITLYTPLHPFGEILYVCNIVSKRAIGRYTTVTTLITGVSIGRKDEKDSKHAFLGEGDTV